MNKEPLEDRKAFRPGARDPDKNRRQGRHGMGPSGWTGDKRLRRLHESGAIRVLRWEPVPQGPVLWLHALRLHAAQLGRTQRGSEPKGRLRPKEKTMKRNITIQQTCNSWKADDGREWPTAAQALKTILAEDRKNTNESGITITTITWIAIDKVGTRVCRALGAAK